MNHNIVEYHRTRREIRKVNRIARVEPPKKYRKLGIAALVLLVVIFVIFECFSLFYSKQAHDRELARSLAEDATIEFSLINASLMSGNQTLLKDSHQKYQKTLNDFNNNSYMKSSQSDLLAKLNNYDTLLNDEIQHARLIKMRTAITMLEKEMQDTDLKKVSTKSMIQTKENIEDFRDSLEELNDTNFQPLITKLTDFSNELTKLIDKTSICVGTCPQKTLTAYYNGLEKVFETYQADLSNLDTQISDYYSPATLVESLKMLQ